jgi:hypothetical protein
VIESSPWIVRVGVLAVPGEIDENSRCQPVFPMGLLIRWEKDKIKWRQQDDLERYLLNDRAFQGYKFI